MPHAPFSLVEYLNRGITKLIKDAMFHSMENPRTAHFLRQYAKHNRDNAKKRRHHEKSGLHVPAFLIASITPQCNLACAGCYARANGQCHDQLDALELTPFEWNHIFQQASNLGVSFCLLAGGEPLLRMEILHIASRFPNMIFPVFTNATLIDGERLEVFNQYRNLIPMISIEGDDHTTDERRGQGVSALIHASVTRLNQLNILFGASITITTKNLNEVMSDPFLHPHEASGCKIVFLIEYVPADMRYASLAFDDTTRHLLEEAVQTAKKKWENLIFLAFPGDEKQSGGCLAAGRGFFHINYKGDGEACPFAPYSDRNLHTHSLIEVLQSPFFQALRTAELVGGEHNGGCSLFQHESEVQDILKEIS